MNAKGLGNFFFWFLPFPPPPLFALLVCLFFGCWFFLFLFFRLAVADISMFGFDGFGLLGFLVFGFWFGFFFGFMCRFVRPLLATPAMSEKAAWIHAPESSLRLGIRVSGSGSNLPHCLRHVAGGAA